MKGDAQTDDFKINKKTAKKSTNTARQLLRTCITTQLRLVEQSWWMQEDKKNFVALKTFKIKKLSRLGCVPFYDHMLPTLSMLCRDCGFSSPGSLLEWPFDT